MIRLIGKILKEEIMGWYFYGAIIPAALIWGIIYRSFHLNSNSNALLLIGTQILLLGFQFICMITLFIKK